MKYFEVVFYFICSNEKLQTAKDLLIDLAESAGFESFDDQKNNLLGYVQKSLFNPKVLDSGIKYFPISEVDISYSINEVEDIDWNQVWEENGFEPINVNDKIIVYDARKMAPEKLSVVKDNILIGINAIQAFGSGNHQTTQMMLSAILNIPLVGKRVLDCGSGTGILSICASKLGALSVAAFDIDEWSVRNTLYNAKINDVQNIQAFQGDSSVIPKIGNTFDIILANINRNILLNDMAAYRSVMSSDSYLMLSGFFITDVPIILEKAISLGLMEIDRQVEDEWCQLTLQRIERSQNSRSLSK